MKGKAGIGTRKRRGQVWVSAVLYILITVVAMVVLLQAGTPIMNSLRDRTAFSKTKDSMLVLDKYIVEVSEGGPGSQRVVPIDIEKGTLYVEDNMVRWKIETDSKLFEPRSKQSLGNMIILGLSPEDTVSAHESSDSCHYILENSRIKVNITQFGMINKSAENCTSQINTSALINYIELNDKNSTAEGVFTFTIAGEPSSEIGTGKTTLIESGDYLSAGVIRAEINSSSYNYTLELSLESGADFLKVKAINLREK
ncbi:MAG: hypothetical protein NTV63_02430 [Candidatus Woesearchaeota archaeon]|nr:hypothetical protein [Candidatus Woesearchaeota archaeon]